MSIEAKVGMFVSAGLLMLLLLSTQVSNVKLFEPKGYTVKTELPDVLGLEVNSKVGANGIDIGYIKSLAFNGNKIVIEMYIYDNIAIPDDSLVEVRQKNMLSGQMIVLKLGNSPVVLNDGEYLKDYKSYSSFENTSDDIDAAAKEAKELMKELREAVDAPTRENFRHAIAQIDELSTNLNALVVNERDAIDRIVTKIDDIATDLKTGAADVPQITKKFEKIEDELYDILVDNRGPLNNTLNSADDMFVQAKKTVKRLDNYLKAIEQSQLEIYMNAEYLLQDGYGRQRIGLEYSPSPSTVYLFNITSGNDFTADPTTGVIRTTYDNVDADYIYTLQFGKRFGDWMIRGGMMESNGGIGVDYFAFSNTLKSSLDLFDFNSSNDVRGTLPAVRLSARYTILKHIDAYAGIDNILNNSSRNLYFGIGMRFIDDDMKKLVGLIAMSTSGNM